MSYSATVLADSPIRYYRLNEQGHVAADASGNNAHGVIVSSGVTLGVSSLVGNSDTCATFDGSTGYIIVPATGSMPAGSSPAFSLECWCKFASNPASVAVMLNIGKWAAGDGPYIGIDSSGHPQCGGHDFGVASSSALTTGAAHHIVATYDGTTMLLYADGIQVATITHSISSLSQNGAFIGEIVGAQFLYSGQIAQCAVYNYTLTATQVGNHHSATGSGYDATILADTPVGYWKLADSAPANNNIADSSTSAQTATLAYGIGTEPGLLTADSDAGMYFQGVAASQISVPTASMPTVNSAWSMEAWVKIYANPSGANAVIMFFGTFAANQGAWLLVGTDGKVQINIHGDTAAVGSSALSLNTKHHIVGTYDGTTMRLYVGGSLAASQAVAAANITLAGAAIGGIPSQTFPLAGEIDEVAWYSTTLTATQVLTHYNVGSNTVTNLTLASNVTEVEALTASIPPITALTLASNVTEVEAISISSLVDLQYVAPLPVYALYVRDNATGDLVDTLDDFIELGAVLNFNGISQLIASLDANSIHTPSALPDSSLNYPLGLILTRDNQDGNGPLPLFTGPISHMTYDYDANSNPPYSIMVTADSDDTDLLINLATPELTTQDYATEVLTDSPTRYYRLGEPSGTTATDATGHANGTYHGSIALGLPGALADNTGTAAAFDGSSAYVDVPVSGLPTGNSAWSLAAWVYVFNKPTDYAVIVDFGTWSDASAANLAINSSGSAYISGAGPSFNSQAASLSLQAWHMVVGTYDGATLTLYVDGEQKDLQKLGSALTVGTTGAAIGRAVDGTHYLPLGTIVEEVAIYSAVLPADRVAALYALGRSHFNLNAYDVRQTTISTMMWNYADANIGASAPTARKISSLVFDADPAVGGTNQEQLRFNTLLEAEQNLSLKATNEIGFQVQQPLTSKNKHFTIYQPRNQESVAIFSRALGNVSRIHWQIDQPAANVAYEAGNGSGVFRAIIQRINSASITRWGRRIEKFYNHSNLSNITDLQQQGDADLATDADVFALGVEIVESDGCVFLRDWKLGDLVTVAVDLPGQDTPILVQDVVRQVLISLKKGQRDVVTPVIGAPGALHPLTINRALHKIINKTQKQVTTLTVNQ